MYQFNNIIDLCVKLEKYDELFSYIQQAKSRAVSEKIKLDKIFSHSVPPELYQDYFRLKSMKNEIISDIMIAKIEENGNCSSLIKKWTKASDNFRVFLNKIKAENPHLVSMLNYPRKQNVTLSDACTRCPSNTLILDMFVAGSQTIIIPITSKLASSKTVIKVPEINQKVLKSVTRKVKKIFADKSYVAEKGILQSFEEAYNPFFDLIRTNLIPKVNKILSDHQLCKIIFIPHREFHLMPFHLFFDEKLEISYCPNFQVVDDIINSENGSSIDRMLIVYPFSEAVNFLFANCEIKAIKQYMQKSVSLIGSEATQEALKNMSQQFDAIHFITHGFFTDSDPEKICLMMEDGKLSFNDILEKHRFPGHSFSFLSACQTGKMAIDDGDEYIGLNHAFMATGVKSVISTMWPVDDLATMLFVKRWYHYYVGLGMSKAQATNKAQLWLREAKWENITNYLLDDESALENILHYRNTKTRWLRNGNPYQYDSIKIDDEKPFEHPFYWAAFYCSGHPAN